MITVRVRNKISVSATVQKKILAQVKFGVPINFNSEAMIIQDYTAGENISGGNIVMMGPGGLVYKFDISDESNYGKCIGVANNAVIAGGICRVILEGECSQLGGLIPDELYYAGANGSVTLTPSGPGVEQEIGVAKNSTTLIVQIQQPTIII